MMPPWRKGLVAWLLLVLGVLTPGSAAAVSALVVDLGQGKMLRADEPTEPHPPGVVARLMVLYLLLQDLERQRLTPSTPLVIPPDAAAADSPGPDLAPWGLMTVTTALDLLALTPSPAVPRVVARNLAGTPERFVDRMQAQSQSLGMKGTLFKTVTGDGPESGQTTVTDAIILAGALMRDFPSAYGLFRQRAISFQGREVANINTLLGEHGVDGLLAGRTAGGGYGAVISAARGERRLLVAVLDGPSLAGTLRHAATLLQQGFAGD